MAITTCNLIEIKSYSTNWTTIIQVIEATLIRTTNRFPTARGYRQFLLSNSQVDMFQLYIIYIEILLC